MTMQPAVIKLEPPQPRQPMVQRPVLTQRPQTHIAPQVPKPTPLPVNVESQPDFQSIKGVFGWTSIDNVNVPYILRSDKQFVSVRIVEMKLLNRYPNSYPDDLGKHAPLTSFFITSNEAKLLNEINLQHCGGEFGKKEFSTKELIVLLSDFIRFYDLVKKTFPDAAAARREAMESAGWLQIKNTVTPYVTRKDGKYVPLSVMQYAAGLLTNEKINGSQPTKHECDLLNEACKAAGVEFVFSDSTTRLINIGDILKLSPIDITELPSSNPLKHATYMELPTTSTQRTTDKSQALPTKSVNKPTNGQPYMFQPSSMMNNQRMPNSVNGQLPVTSQFTQQQPVRHHVFDNVVDQRLSDIINMHYGSQNRPILSQGPPNIRLGQFPLNQMPVGMNPVMNYYLGMQNNQTQRHVQPLNQTVPVNNGNPELNKSRSPGSSSSVSPRSRPPSLTRQSSGSRPPSGSPLSPNSNQFSSSISRGPILPPSVDTIDVQAMSHNTTAVHGSLAIQQLQKMVPQQYSLPKSSHNVNMPYIGQPTNSNNTLLSPTCVVKNSDNSSNPSFTPLSPPVCISKTLHNANQELPGLFTPTGINVSLHRLKELGSSNNTKKSPPPLQSMVEHIASTQNEPVKVQPPKPQTLPTAVSAPPTPLVNSIKGAWLNNKSISCLYLDQDEERSGPFCLVEAVCKLYFNGCSVNEFLFALENVLNVPLLTCNEMEEKAFIQYYSLPVVTLKCNKMIKFEDLDKYFPQLTYMFPSKESLTRSESEIEEPVLTADEYDIPLGNDPRTDGIISVKRSAEHSIEQQPSKQPRVEGNDAIIILD
ncbi:hypothetical protein ACF0H5_013613 [Mactra antiquata]